MSKLWLLMFVVACGAKTVTPVGDPPPTNAEQQGSATTPAEPTGAICGTRGVPPCPENMFCSYQPGADCGEGDKPGHCAAKPEMCAEIFKPVCGCDGKTYPNDCAAAASAVGIRADGECK